MCCGVQGGPRGAAAGVLARRCVAQRGARAGGNERDAPHAKRKTTTDLRFRKEGMGGWSIVLACTADKHARWWDGGGAGEEGRKQRRPSVARAEQRRRRSGVLMRPARARARARARRRAAPLPQACANSSTRARAHTHTHMPGAAGAGGSRGRGEETERGGGTGWGRWRGAAATFLSLLYMVVYEVWQGGGPRDRGGRGGRRERAMCKSKTDWAAAPEGGRRRRKKVRAAAGRGRSAGEAGEEGPTD